MIGTAVRREAPGPAWAAALGALAVVFGVLAAAAQGNEVLLQTVIAPGTAAVRGIPADCREDEAAQEGVSTAECEMMVASVRATIVSRPSWFRAFQLRLALAGLLAAFTSIGVGMALVDFRPWAPRAAALSFSVLAVLDVAGFGAALFTGPLLRAVYLWNIFLWFSIHLSLAAGAVVGLSGAFSPDADGSAVPRASAESV